MRDGLVEQVNEIRILEMYDIVKEKQKIVSEMGSKNVNRHTQTETCNFTSNI